MFWKLRLKLALLNTAVAGVILLAIAAVAHFFIARLITQQSEHAIQLIARNMETSGGFGIYYPAEPVTSAGGLYPYMILRADKNGKFYVLRSDVTVDKDQINKEPINKDQITELITLALAKEQERARGNERIGEGKGGFSTDKGIVFMRRQRSAVVRMSDGQTYRYTITGFRPNAASIYFIFMNLRQEEKLLASVRLALGLSVLGGLVLTGLGGLFLAGRALRPVRAAWLRQRNFVADASHELRSPLAAIRCNLDVVLDDPEAPVKEKLLYWEGISEETERMSVLVDELLLLARADSGAVELRKEPVDLAALAESAVSFLRPLAEKKGVELKLADSAAATVTGDPARLKQVLVALVDNAVKYTPAGGAVAVSVRRAKDKATVEVADTGIGIAKEHLEKIFERFYRVDKARERERGGYGLGLSIAQWIVERHGGSITVSSVEGKGSTFAVSLPLGKN